MHVLIMKKILAILLLSVAVILTAGCISDGPEEPYIPGEDEEIIAWYTVTVEKVASNIYPGDKLVIAIPSSGYTWEVTESSGLDYEEDFEYTENGWRISGGDALQAFLSPNHRNPDTSDNGIVIVVCATVALVGIALTANKRRFAMK